MSALMTPRRSRRTRRDAARRPAAQPSLFGTVEAVTEAAAVPETFGPAATPEAATVAPEPEPESEPAASPETFTTASARRQGPTLDDLVAGAWEGLLAGAPADCLVCGTPLSPRHSAGAGIVGGRCGGCGSTLG
jgi:hypothetical protein